MDCECSSWHQLTAAPAFAPTTNLASEVCQFKSSSCTGAHVGSTAFNGVRHANVLHARLAFNRADGTTAWVLYEPAVMGLCGPRWIVHTHTAFSCSPSRDTNGWTHKAYETKGDWQACRRQRVSWLCRRSSAHAATSVNWFKCTAIYLLALPLFSAPNRATEEPATLLLLYLFAHHSSRLQLSNQPSVHGPIPLQRSR